MQEYVLDYVKLKTNTITNLQKQWRATIQTSVIPYWLHHYWLYDANIKCYDENPISKSTDVRKE